MKKPEEKNEFKKSEKIVEKIDIVTALEDIEQLTQATESTLSQIQYSRKSICVKIETSKIEPFINMLPKNTKIKHKDNAKGIVQYCYETI